MFSGIMYSDSQTETNSARRATPRDATAMKGLAKDCADISL